MEEKKRVIALGFFDGIHIGHSALMERALKISRQTGMTPSVITFDAHPMSMVTGHSVLLINSPEDRAGLIHRIFGIDDVIFVHFDKDTMRMSWGAFLNQLVHDFNAGYLVAGHDFRFGYRGEGTAQRLQEKCAELGLGCDIISPVKHNGIISSSTYIRKLLLDGKIEQANEFLGHPHVLSGVVKYGHRLGRRLGAPTINLSFSQGVLVPAYGVYATRVILDDKREFSGVTNVGVRPTVDDLGRVITAETYILGFEGNLYGRTVRIEFYKHMRPERHFENIQLLKEQIASDAEAVKAYFDENMK